MTCLISNTSLQVSDDGGRFKSYTDVTKMLQSYIRKSSDSSGRRPKRFIK